jgi:RTX calcium-binding nonapeptide repeat (4 copies)
MLRGTSSRGYKQRKGRRTVVRQGQLIAVVVVFLIGCAVLLLVVGCSGVRSGASKKEQGRSPKATASEEARCEGTRTLHHYVVAYGRGLYSKQRSGSEEDMKKADKKAGQKTEVIDVYTTNDLPGCPKGGLLLGTDKADVDPYPDHPGLEGQDGDDEIRGLGANDALSGGDGNDVLYGGPGEDRINGGKGEDVIYGGDGNDISKWPGHGTVPMLDGGPGEDMIYGGDGNDSLAAKDGQRDKLYCGKGKDGYFADKNDYVDSSCEVPFHPPQCCAA